MTNRLPKLSKKENSVVPTGNLGRTSKNAKSRADGEKLMNR